MLVEVVDRHYLEEEGVEEGPEEDREIAFKPKRVFYEGRHKTVIFQERRGRHGSYIRVVGYQRSLESMWMMGMPPRLYSIVRAEPVPEGERAEVASLVSRYAKGPLEFMM